LVRTEGARLGLADADASEPHATSALADERFIDRWRRSQDDAPTRSERGRPEDHREALHGAAQNDREAEHREAEDRQAHYGEAHYGEAWRPQDRDAPPNRWSLDREARDTSQLDAKEAPLSDDQDLKEGGHAGGVPSLVPFPPAHPGLTSVVRLLAAPPQLSAGFLLLLSFAHSYLSSQGSGLVRA